VGPHDRMARSPAEQDPQHIARPRRPKRRRVQRFVRGARCIRALSLEHGMPGGGCTRALSPDRSSSVEKPPRSRFADERKLQDERARYAAQPKRYASLSEVRHPTAHGRKRSWLHDQRQSLLPAGDLYD
jgi:hypothetical protein